MSSVSVIFRKDKLNSDLVAPIHLRIIKDRKINYISTGVLVPSKFWDEKNKKVKSGFPNSNRLNSYISNKFTELQDQVFEHETVSKSLTTRQLKEKIYGRKPTDFFAFADEATERYLQAGKISTYDKCRSILRKLKDYYKFSEISFQDITPHFLMNYESYLRKQFNNSTNTIHRDFRYLRKLFNDAYRLDLIEHNQNPFHKYHLKLEKTQRTFLSEEELHWIEKFPATPGTRLELHQDMFVFASYSGGLRVSDILQLKWENFNGTHIGFTIKKTGQQVSIKLPEKAIAIIDKYKSKKLQPDGFIFPMLKDDLNMQDLRAVDNALSSATAYINKNLKIIAEKVGINKPLSFHISRHTWATRALRKGLSIDKVSKLMGHSAIKETQIYAKLVNEELDKAMDLFNN